MQRLPEKFIENMKKQLPQTEWEAFFAVYSKKPHKGIRVNALKCPSEVFEKITPFPLTPVPWAENRYKVEAEKTGAHPYHFAGLYYSQEPSAMCAAPLLEAKSGERVLDLCAAPGGKSTQLAASMDGEGILIVNEPVLSRAQILSSNIERMGVRNALVLSEYPEKLNGYFAGYFDKILVDAPCSGEGMFRKNAEEALGEWSEENVALCAERQRLILEEATKMLRAGGRLVYSTCTFSEAEDEGQVCDYLKNHPEMKLKKTEKLYPHKVAGEGHFAAVFEKQTWAETQACRVKPLRPRISNESEKLYRGFEKSFFNAPLKGELHEAGGILYLLPQGAPDWKGLRILRAGVRLGEVKNGRFEPSHSLAMCVKGEACNNLLSLPLSDLRTDKFLRGETIEVSENELQNGWCLVAVDGYPIGLGKAVNGTVKNHIPKALRRSL